MGELQLLYSEVASQRVIGDQSEMEDLKRLSSMNLDQSLNQDSFKEEELMGAMNFKQSLQTLLNTEDIHEVFRDIVMEYMPEEDYEKVDTVSPINLLSVCKAMSEKIKTLEMDSQCKIRSPCPVQPALVDLNVTDVSCTEKEKEKKRHNDESSMTDCLVLPRVDSREMSNETKSIICDQQIAVSIESERINQAKKVNDVQTQTEFAIQLYHKTGKRETEAVPVANTGCAWP